MNRETIAADLETWLAAGNQITQLPCSLDTTMSDYEISITAILSTQRAASRARGTAKMAAKNRNRTTKTRGRV